MSRSVITKSFFVIMLSGVLFYRYLEMQNELTLARLELPKIAQDVKVIEEENSRLRYSINALENPERLIELARQREFSHLKFPYSVDVVRLQKREPLIARAKSAEKEKKAFRFKPSFVIGAKS